VLIKAALGIRVFYTQRRLILINEPGLIAYMSDHATTPETYAAWRFLELYDELRPYDGERVEILSGNEELALLLAGTEHSFPP
jgi:hypothetical protein